MKQKPLTISKLASLIALKEGKKHNATMGDVREILSILTQMISDDASASVLYVLIGAARKKRKTKR